MTCVLLMGVMRLLDVAFVQSDDVVPAFAMTLELQRQALLIDTATTASAHASCAVERAKSQRRPVEWREIGMTTADGKMKAVVLLVSEKHVCTGFATALAD